MRDLTRFAWLSVATAVLGLVLKMMAYWHTNSVGLLSDALESIVNLSAAALAGAMLKWAAAPPDEDHVFGHEKAEYLSSGVEGALILVAAGGIFVSAGDRLLQPQPLAQLGFGMVMSSLASLANLITAGILHWAARRHRSVALRAEAHHLMTDVFTTGAIWVGLGLVYWTRTAWIDPLVAILAGLWISRSGVDILRNATQGIMDASLPPETLRRIEATLQPYRERGLDFHALRTRQAGRSSYVQIHVLVPGEWSVHRGHDLLEELEESLRQAVPGVRLHTHLEPLEDPASFQDVELERGVTG